MSANLPDRVQTEIVGILRCEDKFAWDKPLADLGADSLDTIELTMALEREFNVAVDMDMAEGWNTPGDVLATVQGLVS